MFVRLKSSSLSRTEEWVLSKLVQNVENALANDDQGAANRALELIGKEHGMFIDPQREGNPGDFAALHGVEAIVAKVRAEIGEQAADVLAALVSPKSDQEQAISETQGNC